MTVAHDFVGPYTPQWSPDGSVVYFISDVDGPNCLWGVRVPEHSTSSLEAFPVQHFHNPRYSLRGSFALAGNRCYFGIQEITGNVWLGKLPRADRY